jgi:spore coat protein H
MQVLSRNRWLCVLLLLPACGGGGGGGETVDGGSDGGTQPDSATDTRADVVRLDVYREDGNTGGDGNTGTDSNNQTDGNATDGSATLVWGAFGPVVSPTQTLIEINVTSVPEAGGPTIMTLNADTDRGAEVPVIFKSGTYAMDATLPNGTIELRGASTRLSSQKSYTIKLDDAEPGWEGTHTIFLNKHPYDLTRLRNKLAFDLFYAIPELMTLKTAWVHLTIDGQDYGLFTQVEHVGPRFKREHGFGDTAGPLYKPKLFEFGLVPALKLQSDPTYNEDAFEALVEIKGTKDHVAFMAMLRAVNDGGRNINDVVAQHFDRKNYLTWLAVNILTRNLDTTTQNFYLAASANSDRFIFIPWDYDGAWGFYEQPNESGNVLPRWRSGVSNWWPAPLHRRFLSDPNNLNQLKARVDQLAAEFFTNARIKALTDVYKPLVMGAINKTPDLSRLPTHDSDKMAAWNTEVDRLLTIVAQEKVRFHDTLARPMPFFLGTPLVGEASVMFNWDRAVDVHGDTVSYDLQISTTPDFASLTVEQTGIAGTVMLLPQTLPPGTYYWRVIARDSVDPTNNWQVAFDEVRMNNIRYMGVKTFTVQ